MKTGICHYSLRRRYAAEKWDPARLVQEVKTLGLDCVDFHALSERLRQNSLQEKLTAQWIQHCMTELRQQRQLV